MYKRDPRIKALLTWFRVHGRELPWRGIDDPYQIFISEIMLQQTQAARVIEYYSKWLKRFPDWKALANATTPQLLQAWAGLGYNRRALFLREAAKQIVERGIPKTEEEWRSLKGVGPYTAAAVHAFVSKQPTTAIDTNIRRVIGRAFLGLPFPALGDDIRVSKVLKNALTDKEDWLALHALMDLGALICIPKSPRCEICPLRKECKARKYFLPSAPVISKPLMHTKEHIQEGKKFPDRIYRGRILKAVREKKSVSLRHLGDLIDPAFNYPEDQPWLLRMVDRMKRDGFIEQKNDRLVIPKQ